MKPSTIADLLGRSNRLGSDPRNTNYAGGNTSACGEVVDPVTGKPIEVMWVKGSGGDLGTLTEAGLSVLRLDRMRGLVDVFRGEEHDDEMVAAFSYCLHGTGWGHPFYRHGNARTDRTRPCGSPPPRLWYRSCHCR